MEFIEGQVLSIKNLSEHIKEVRENKQKNIKHQELLGLLARSKEEIDSLKSSLNNTNDTEAIESSIYRLKAAELDLNRQLKIIKVTHELK